MGYFPERKYPRYAFESLACVFSLRLTEAPPSDKPLRLEARNLSLGGLKFVSNRRFNLFENLEVVLIEKPAGKALPPVQGKVVRVEEVDIGKGEKTFGIALEFSARAEAIAHLLPPLSDSRNPAK